MEEWSKRCAQYSPGSGALRPWIDLGQLVRVTENGQRGRKHQQLESACRMELVMFESMYYELVVGWLIGLRDPTSFAQTHPPGFPGGMSWHLGQCSGMP